jgi:hypothetical protein
LPKLFNINLDPVEDPGGILKLICSVTLLTPVPLHSPQFSIVGTEPKTLQFNQVTFPEVSV